MDILYFAAATVIFGGTIDFVFTATVKVYVMLSNLYTSVSGLLLLSTVMTF